MWDAPLPFMDEPLPSGVSITFDRKRFDEADAVVFHLPDLSRYMGSEDIIKKDGQVWVGWSLECEENYPFLKDSAFRGMFDLWMGYHLSDDILYPYFMDYEERMLSRQETLQFGDRKGICMLISSNINHSHRVEYVSELMKHIEIDSYGRLFNNCKIESDSGRQSAIDIMGKFKCVIAFENAIARDYVTEKFYNPLYAGAVPIYLGAPNISDFVPDDRCFINVADYDSTNKLVAYIERLMVDESLWMRYTSFVSTPYKQTFREKLNRSKPNPIYLLCHTILKKLKFGV